MRQPVEIQTLPKGAFFKRKPDARDVYVRDVYISAHVDELNIARPGYVCCFDADEYDREIFLKPSTLVYVDFEY